MRSRPTRTASPFAKLQRVGEAHATTPPWARRPTRWSFVSRRQPTRTLQRVGFTHARAPRTRCRACRTRCAAVRSERATLSEIMNVMKEVFGIYEESTQI